MSVVSSNGDATAGNPSPALTRRGDLVQLDPRTIGPIYETGAAGRYETLTFQRIPVRGVKG